MGLHLFFFSWLRMGLVFSAHSNANLLNLQDTWKTAPGSSQH